MTLQTNQTYEGVIILSAASKILKKSNCRGSHLRVLENTGKLDGKVEA